MAARLLPLEGFSGSVSSWTSRIVHRGTHLLQGDGRGSYQMSLTLSGTLSRTFVGGFNGFLGKTRPPITHLSDQSGPQHLWHDLYLRRAKAEADSDPRRVILLFVRIPYLYNALCLRNVGVGSID